MGDSFLTVLMAQRICAHDYSSWLGKGGVRMREREEGLFATNIRLNSKYCIMQSFIAVVDFAFVTSVIMTKS